MKILREFDKRLLYSFFYLMIVVMAEVIHWVLWFLVSIRKIQITIGWSVGILIFLCFLLGFHLLFQIEDGRLVFIYDKIKYYPVDRKQYWLVKMIPIGKLIVIHCLVGGIAALLAYLLGIW